MTIIKSKKKKFISISIFYFFLVWKLFFKVWGHVYDCGYTASHGCVCKITLDRTHDSNSTSSRGSISHWDVSLHCLLIDKNLSKNATISYNNLWVNKKKRNAFSELTMKLGLTMYQTLFTISYLQYFPKAVPLYIHDAISLIDQ